MKPLRPALALLVLGSLVPSGGADAAPGGNPLRPFVAKNKLYALWVPTQWTVHDEAGDDSFRVLAESPDRASAVEFYWQRRDQGRANMLQLLGQYRAVLCRRHPDAVFSEVRTSGDGARAAIGVQYRAGRRSIGGKIYFEAGAAGFSVQGYFAPQERLTSDRPLLLNVYQTDSHGTRDTATGDYYEGRGYNWVNFEGQSPNHPSETMREISSGELQELNRRR
jgi:hypothetical protein